MGTSSLDGEVIYPCFLVKVVGKCRIMAATVKCKNSNMMTRDMANLLEPMYKMLCVILVIVQNY